MTEPTIEGMATPEDMIDAHLRYLRAGRFAARTIDDARKLLTRAHRELPEGLHGATLAELEDFLANPGWSTETALTYYKHLRRLYRWAVRPADQWISFDPSEELVRPKSAAELPRPAADDVVRACIHDTEDPWRLYCRLAALAGLRPCEIATVRRQDIGEVIRIKGKGGRTRTVPTHPLIAELVEPLPAGVIATRPSGKRVTAYWMSKATAQYLRSVGIDTTLYPLRHAFATKVEEKHDVRAAQVLLGHASITTTTRYTLISRKRQQAAIDDLDFG
ncbi:tyrosine-type recombinase/integrase [Micromonospora andamanensis]|uniref:Integrase n=1 Tax=Micromonospora andamanensis TaxID=1287068 RepID=A0ABQ4HYK1_9ACTN|nr:tyrosine-type recombinase/integrase [Micromonospora andamanensis]GIJ10709.1 integrase [Micromonospora andamanensis]